MRKYFSQSISHNENVVTGMLEELKIKFEKLELKVVKMEVVNFSGSSSHYGENQMNFSLLIIVLVVLCLSTDIRI